MSNSTFSIQYSIACSLIPSLPSSMSLCYIIETNKTSDHPHRTTLHPLISTDRSPDLARSNLDLISILEPSVKTHPTRRRNNTPQPGTKTNSPQHSPSTSQPLRVPHHQLLPANKTAQPLFALVLAQALRKPIAPAPEAHPPSFFHMVDATLWIHG